MAATIAAKESPFRPELEGVGGASKEKNAPPAGWQVRVNASMGIGAMIKWNEKVSNTAEEDLMIRSKRQQDDEFCRALRAALWTGKESCPEGVTTEPSTKKPILNYRPPH
jgi:hypothetical protein